MLSPQSKVKVACKEYDTNNFWTSPSFYCSKICLVTAWLTSSHYGLVRSKHVDNYHENVDDKESLMTLTNNRTGRPFLYMVCIAGGCYLKSTSSPAELNLSGINSSSTSLLLADSEELKQAVFFYYQPLLLNIWVQKVFIFIRIWRVDILNFVWIIHPKKGSLNTDL